MMKEAYERLAMDVTKFDVEDVIVTSGEEPTPTPPSYTPGDYELGGGTGSLPTGF